MGAGAADPYALGASRPAVAGLAEGLETDSIDLSITVVIHSITHFGAGRALGADLGHAAHTRIDRAGAGSHAAGQAAEPIVNLSITVIVHPVTDLCAAHRDYVVAHLTRGLAGASVDAKWRTLSGAR